MRRRRFGAGRAEYSGLRGWRTGRRRGIGCASSRSGILLSTCSRNTRNIIDVCAPRACRVIGRRKLTCERPGNIARIKKLGEMGRKRVRAFAFALAYPRTVNVLRESSEGVSRGARIKIGGCALVRFPCFFPFFFFPPRVRSYEAAASTVPCFYLLLLLRHRVPTSCSCTLFATRGITSIIRASGRRREISTLRARDEYSGRESAQRSRVLRQPCFRWRNCVPLRFSACFFLRSPLAGIIVIFVVSRRSFGSVRCLISRVIAKNSLTISTIILISVCFSFSDANVIFVK